MAPRSASARRTTLPALSIALIEPLKPKTCDRHGRSGQLIVADGGARGFRRQHRADPIRHFGRHRTVRNDDEVLAPDVIVRLANVSLPLAVLKLIPVKQLCVPSAQISGRATGVTPSFAKTREVVSVFGAAAMLTPLP